MAQGLHLSQRLTQSLILAPQLQQSLALLQAPLLELKTLVEQELQQNPVLEELPPGAPETSELEGEAVRPEQLDPAEPPADVRYDPALERRSTEPVDDFQAEFDRLLQLDQEWREHFQQAQLAQPVSPEDEERRQFMFDSLVASPSMQQDLLEQMRESDLPETDYPVGELIIGNLDERGYLTATVEEIAQEAKTTPEHVERVLRAIQSLEPPGIAARTLQECLLLQLERAGQKDSLEYHLVRDHMDLLARRKVPDLARLTGTTLEEVQAALQRIGRLDPRPGRAYQPDTDLYVVPEVFVQKVGDEYVVTANQDYLPRLRISTTYRDLMARAPVDTVALAQAFEGCGEPIRTLLEQALTAIRSDQDQTALQYLKQIGECTELTRAQRQALQVAHAQVVEKAAFLEARNFIREKIRAGRFLIRSIHQRQETILSIARQIVQRQRDFFDKGPSHLKPLTMATVAEAVGVHETTVSRAVNGKYMQTPRGLFEMRYFFTTGVRTANGDGLSNTSVKEMIAEIFRNEDPANPLSDDEVVKILRQRGIVIARRTVAKYRMELGILASNLRRIYTSRPKERPLRREAPAGNQTSLVPPSGDPETNSVGAANTLASAESGEGPSDKPVGESASLSHVPSPQAEPVPPLVPAAANGVLSSRGTNAEQTDEPKIENSPARMKPLETGVSPVPAESDAAALSPQSAASGQQS
ncbi:MAG: RNA polymerase sigma-54 factor [Verrucomicrobiota bacterium]|nr:RNA polymerase sigma-54 factor [Limisphaera sp.]MDW8382413.1 RNA polymerase sigma-54 factor [Verrucomicrobiota bacterium]